MAGRAEGSPQGSVTVHEVIDTCEHGLPRGTELRCLLCLERYDPMNRKELIAECERLRAENESLRRRLQKGAEDHSR